MIDFYPEIRTVHMIAVLASGALFFVRGLALNLGAKWPMVAPLRYLSYTIDTALLTAALMLASILHQYPFAAGWVTTKVVLLIVYVGLGSFALKRGRSSRVRIATWTAAVAVYAFIITVAIAHHPLGVFWLMRDG